jgi:hypothetical protein
MLSCALIATALTLPQPAIASEMPELPAQLQEKVNLAQKACADFTYLQRGEDQLTLGQLRTFLEDCE